MGKALRKRLMSGQRSNLKNDWTGKQRTTRHVYEVMNEENGVSHQSSHGKDRS
jgi:hypothetical protein